MMRSETAAVLAKIAAVDNRRLDPPHADLDNPASTPILSTWHELIGDLQVRDCLDAVRQHRATSTEWLQPAHVIAGVKAIRARRLESLPSSGELMAGVDPDLPPGDYVRELRARRDAYLDGTLVVAATESGVGLLDRPGTARRVASLLRQAPGRSAR